MGGGFGYSKGRKKQMSLHLKLIFSQILVIRLRGYLQIFLMVKMFSYTDLSGMLIIGYYFSFKYTPEQ